MDGDKNIEERDECEGGCIKHHEVMYDVQRGGKGEGVCMEGLCNCSDIAKWADILVKSVTKLW